MIKSAFTQYALFVLLISLLTVGCANPLPLTGGAKDERPPAIDSSRYSTPNYSTNFSGKKITLAFDEWVKVEDVAKQLWVSPPMRFPPTLLVKGKNVVLTFQDSLRQNTTYSVNFGTSIRDITEGNAAKDFRFVFSTGAVLDSLSIRGSVALAADNQAATEVLIMLYEGKDDSLPFKQAPYYFARTDANGQFSLENIREGSYKVFLLKDSNQNYRYDQEGEQIGFLPNPINIQPDSILSLKLQLFEEKKPLQILNVQQAHYGKIKIVYNTKLKDRDVAVLPLAGQDYSLLHGTIEGDTLFVYYERATQDSLQLSIVPDIGKEDTLLLLPPSKATLDKLFLTAALGETIVLPTKGQKSPTPIAQTAKVYSRNRIPNLRFNLPLLVLDSLRCQVMQSDSSPIAAVWRIDPIDPLQLNVSFKAKEDMTYQIVLLPKAVTSVGGISLSDSLLFLIRIDKDKAYGRLKVKVNSLDTASQYIVIIEDKNSKPIETMTTSRKAKQEFVVAGLSVGEYRVRLVEDKNRNGRWDTGNYLQKLQPERITVSPLLGLRADWEGEIEVNPDLENKAAKGKSK